MEGIRDLVTGGETGRVGGKGVRGRPGKGRMHILPPGRLQATAAPVNHMLASSSSQVQEVKNRPRGQDEGRNDPQPM